MASVRELRFTESGWQIRAAAKRLAPAAAEQLAVSGVLLPPAVADGGIWVAHRSGSRHPAVGWGALVDRQPRSSGTVITGPGRGSATAALRLPALGIWRSLDDLRDTGRTTVLGDGLLEEIARRVLADRNVEVTGLEADRELDTVVDLTGDPKRWATGLAALGAEGTFVSLVPPWSRSTGELDLYPHIHRRSLRLVALRWHLPASVPDADLAERLHSIVSGALDNSDQVARLEPSGPERHEARWRWFEWPAP